MKGNIIEGLAESLYEKDRVSPQQCTWEQMTSFGGPDIHGQKLEKYRRLAWELAANDN